MCADAHQYEDHNNRDLEHVAVPIPVALATCRLIDAAELLPAAGKRRDRGWHVFHVWPYAGAAGAEHGHLIRVCITLHAFPRWRCGPIQHYLQCQEADESGLSTGSRT